MNEPLVDVNSRAGLIRWLEWNDPNGTYNDGASIIEFGEPATIEELRECYDDQTTR